jgi:hypothetical protein
MAELSQIEEVLRSAIDRGDVPGVVAMLSNQDGVVYHGAIWAAAFIRSLDDARYVSMKRLSRR